MNSCRFYEPLKLLYVVKLHAISAVLLTCGMSSTSECSSEVNEERKIIMPPLAVRGMKRLNRDMFTITVDVPYIEITIGNVGPLIKYLKPYFMKVRNMKVIQNVDNETDEAIGIDSTASSQRKMVIMNPDVVKSFNSIREPVKEKLAKVGVTELKYRKLLITYNNWSIEEILKAVFPKGIRFSGYSVVGHIIHLNLRDNVLDYKYLIGQVLLDKMVHAKTVVNKIKNIDNVYRNFNMELICGVNNMMVDMNQDGIRYQFDFSAVYWNTRLSTEHERIVKKLKRGDYLYDVFCGVGPFVLPAAKKGCICLANDLNPEAIRWLHVNIAANKIYKPNVVTFNKDGHEFIKQDIRRHLLNIKKYRQGDFTIHIAMNLPSSSVVFLHDFRALFTPEEYEEIPHDIQVHAYCFVKGEYELQVAMDLAKGLVEARIGKKLTDDLLEVVNVRHVSPNKDMYRVSFKLTREVLVLRNGDPPHFLKGQDYWEAVGGFCGDSNNENNK